MANVWDASVKTFIHSNTALLGILKRAVAEMPDTEGLADARLADDMLPLSFQVQMVSNVSRQTVNRLTGQDVGVWEDNEKTLPELITRVEKTLEVLHAVDRKAFEAVDATKITEVLLGPMKVPIRFWDSLFGHSLPNLFFHLTTAYDILRNRGLKLGKMDFAGPFVTGYVTLPQH